MLVGRLLARGAPAAGSATTSTRPSPTIQSPTACGGEAEGIIRSFCDGTATVSFDLGDEHAELTGGTCSVTIAYLDVVVGTETGEAFGGARLDFVDLQLPVTTGSFDAGEAGVVWDGRVARVPRVTGTHDATSGSFEGRTDDGRPLSGTFSCGAARTSGGGG